MKRSLGEGSPWDPACFQLETSPLVRAFSQAEGPVGREGLFTGCMVQGERAENPGPGRPDVRAMVQGMEAPHRELEPPGRSRLGSETKAQVGGSIVEVEREQLTSQVRDSGEAGLQNR